MSESEADKPFFSLLSILLVTGNCETNLNSEIKISKDFDQILVEQTFFLNKHDFVCSTFFKNLLFLRNVFSKLKSETYVILFEGVIYYLFERNGK